MGLSVEEMRMVGKMNEARKVWLRIRKILDQHYTEEEASARNVENMQGTEVEIAY